MSKRFLFSYALLTFSFLSFPLSAECISSPDCTELGYDKTSCPSGDGIVRCPFDTSQVKCIPLTCETIGKKTCGDMCVPNSFTGCCSNSDCNFGELCIEHGCQGINCMVGDFFYNDRTCSSSYNSGKTPIGVVGYVSNGGNHGLVVARKQSSSVLYWAEVYENLSCISDMPGSDNGSNPELRADRNGKSNTACIMKQVESLGTGKYPAGEYCNGLNIEGVSGWYLPAGGELYDVIVTNLTKVNSGLSKIPSAELIPTNKYHWSSSEYSESPAAAAWYLEAGDGRWQWDDKVLNQIQVRCVLDF